MKSKETVEIVYNNELTEKEVTFLKTMSQSDFWENGIDSILWDYSVNEWLPYTGKVRSGVVSSLAQKGIIIVTKKEKGDIARTYSLTEEAKADIVILEIIVPKKITEMILENKEQTEEAGVDVDFIGTWKDGMEPKKFETNLLNFLKPSYSCEVTQVKDSQRNVYIINGVEKNIKMLISNFQFLTEEIRNEANKQYKESDKTLSKFKFISLFQEEKLGMLSKLKEESQK